MLCAARRRYPMPEHVYYAVIPYAGVRIPPEGITYLDLFTVPYYEPAIDRMSYGVVIYDRLLSPQEIAGSGLVSEPRD